MLKTTVLRYSAAYVTAAVTAVLTQSPTCPNQPLYKTENLRLTFYKTVCSFQTEMSFSPNEMDI